MMNLNGTERQAMKLIPAILCGGAGSRLWPVSREQHPKPFIRLADGQSLLQKAFIRGASLPDVADIMTVTNRELFFKTRDDFNEVNAAHLPTSYILEPFGRNTTAAIAAAVRSVEKTHGTDAYMLVLAADHLIDNQPAFADAVQAALALAEKGHLVTFGIHPDRPETGYGYIESEGNTVLQFVEKPSLDKAREYLASGKFLWNSGMFCFRLDVMLSAMRELCPEILDAVDACIATSGTVQSGGVTGFELDAATFAKVPEQSIDYAVMEKSRDIAVVPCNIGWSDIGSWTAMADLVTPDAHGNAVDGEALLDDVKNCYIRSDGRVIGAIGVDNLVIVDTPDALLVADKARAQDVKNLYAELKRRGNDVYKTHRTVHRPWGTYSVLDEGNGFKIKHIEVKPGQSLSLQMHHHRSEHWIVVSGMAKVVNGDKEMFVRINESTYIPAGNKHRLENPGSLNLVMIEVQSGQYLGEDDIVRFDDVYGRTKWN
jgi:mannose-1-phosphate guanylyltransferase/mannose-6-phosphate isomerase